MNKRLTALYDRIPPGIGMIDVGTDHGYLPAALAASGYPGRILASDLRIEPLRAAEKTAARAGVSERIEFRLCDGLALCPPDAVDTIVIAGMGGDTIVKILDEAEFCMDSRYLLILQPMTKPEVLRYWLAYNEFEILSEALVQETGELYQILTARFGGSTKLCDAELFVGKASLAEDPALYRLALDQLEMRLFKALDGMRGREDFSPRLRLYREVEMQVKELRKSV